MLLAGGGVSTHVATAAGWASSPASEVKAGGDTGIAWKLACKGKDGPMNGSGTMKPGPTGYSAEVRLERKAGGKTLKIDEKTNGRWLGACQ